MQRTRHGVSHPRVRSRATGVAVSNLSVGSGLITTFSCWAHLTTSAPFRARPIGSVSGRLSQTASRRGLDCWSGFPLLFGCRHSLLGHPVPAREFSVPHGRPTEPQVRTQTGLPRSAHTSYDQGGRPLYPEDHGAHPGQSRSLTSMRRLLKRPVLAPRNNHHPCEALLNEASTRGSHEFARPVFPSPDTPGWIRHALGFPRASHPAITHNARRGGDRPN